MTKKYKENENIFGCLYASSMKLHRKEKELGILIVETELDITGIPETSCDDSRLKY